MNVGELLVRILISFDNIIMGNHLCPANKKDLIQNFTDIEKG